MPRQVSENMGYDPAVIDFDPAGIHSFTREELERYERYVQSYAQMGATSFTSSNIFGVDQSCLSDDKPEKEYNVMPKKYNKLKEWSINARALKSAINYCISCNSSGRQQYSTSYYKFKAVYDNKFKLYRIWNKTTQNVVCTVRVVRTDNSDKNVFVRYRPNSHYAPVLAEINKQEKTVGNGKCTFYSVPSLNLGKHRGSLSYALEGVKDTKAEQAEYRKRIQRRKVELNGA